MADFKTIETQEELDAIIEKRLAREREASNKSYEGFISPEDHKRALAEAAKSFDDYKKAHEGDLKTIEDLNAKIKDYETDSLKNRIAHEVGLGYEWIGRIGGDDETTIRADAEKLKALVGNGPTLLPTKNMEGGTEGNEKDAAMRQVLNSIKTPK